MAYKLLDLFVKEGNRYVPNFLSNQIKLSPYI